jgi:hypothetical protein
MKINDIISETTSGGISAVATTFGDPAEMHRSIYSTTPTKKKKPKNKILRRINTEEQNNG